MGGGRPRAGHQISLLPRSPPPSFLRRQEPAPLPPSHPSRPPPAQITPLPPIHPSPLPGGRLGGGWKATSRPTKSRHFPDRPPPDHPRTPSVTPASLPVIPAQAGTRTLSVTPAPPRHSCAGRNPRRPSVTPAAPTTHPTPTPFPQFIPPPLPGGRLGGGWKAASRPTKSRHFPDPPPPSFLRRQEPAPPHHPRTPPPLRAIPAPLPVIPAQAGTPHHTPSASNTA